MTKEINQLTKKELREFQDAIGILSKLFGLTGDDIDFFFEFMKDSRKVSEAIKDMSRRVESLERALQGRTSSESREKISKALEMLNSRKEEYSI